MARSSTPGTAASMAASRGKSLRTSGSPPGRRTLETPIRASSATRRVISSNESTSARSSHGRPSVGMQYWQRKLQRSVTEIRTSPMGRPWPSTSGAQSVSPAPAMGLRPLAVPVTGLPPGLVEQGDLLDDDALLDALDHVVHGECPDGG